MKMWKNYRPSELTAETPDADLKAPVREAQNNLYVAVGNGTDSLNLQSQLNALAEAEGQYEVARQFVFLLRPVEGVRPALSRERAVLAMADTFAGKTADDTWSGRTNEIRRVKHDAAREMFAELFQHVLTYNDEFTSKIA